MRRASASPNCGGHIALLALLPARLLLCIFPGFCSPPVCSAWLWGVLSLSPLCVSPPLPPCPAPPRLAVLRSRFALSRLRLLSLCLFLSPLAAALSSRPHPLTISRAHPRLTVALLRATPPPPWPSGWTTCGFGDLQQRTQHELQRPDRGDYARVLQKRLPTRLDK